MGKVLKKALLLASQGSGPLSGIVPCNRARIRNGEDVLMADDSNVPFEKRCYPLAKPQFHFSSFSASYANCPEFSFLQDGVGLSAKVLNPIYYRGRTEEFIISQCDGDCMWMGTYQARASKALSDYILSVLRSAREQWIEDAAKYHKYDEAKYAKVLRELKECFDRSMERFDRHLKLDPPPVLMSFMDRELIDPVKRDRALLVDPYLSNLFGVGAHQHNKPSPLMTLGDSSVRVMRYPYIYNRHEPCARNGAFLVKRNGVVNWIQFSDLNGVPANDFIIKEPLLKGEKMPVVRYMTTREAQDVLKIIRLELGADVGLHSLLDRLERDALKLGIRAEAFGTDGTSQGGIFYSDSICNMPFEEFKLSREYG